MILMKCKMNNNLVHATKVNKKVLLAPSNYSWMKLQFEI